MFKTIATIITISMIAMLGMNNYNYDKAWKEVDKFLEEGLPKSALEKVDEIYNAAVKESNTVQQVKATNYHSSLVLNTEELGLETVITTLNTRIEQSSEPVKNILQSTSAELIQQYFQQNYWQLSQRTDLGEPTTDIRTWAPNNYRNYISQLYLSSLEGNLVDYKSADYKAIIPHYDKSDKNMRPDLYGLLLDRAMSYFSQSFYGDDSAVDRFLLDEEEYLAAANIFSAKQIESRDQESMRYRLLTLHQDALRYADDKKSDRMTAAYDLSRLQYVYTNTRLTNKKELYLNALELGEKAMSLPEAKEIYGIAIAQHLQAEGKYADALDKAQAVKKYASSTGKARLENIILNIKQPFYSITGREVYSTKEDLVFRVESKNLNGIKVEIAKVAPLELSKNRRKEELLKYIKGLPTVSSQKVNLEQSYVHKPTLFKAKDLPKGMYIMRSSAEGSFYYFPFWVSDLAFNVINNTDNNKIIVRDRNTGKAIAGAKVNLFSQNYKRDHYERNYVRSLTTDNNGIAYLHGLNKNYMMSVNTTEDHLDLQNGISTYYNDHYNNRGRVEIFTDRAIYRPGHTVYYKGIVLSFDKNKVPELIREGVVEAILLDANGQEVHKTDLTINEFGAVSGAFTLPEGLLTGYFTLTLSNVGAQGSKSIRVEEYKRPKFEVTFEESNGKWAINDSVTIKGKAKYYSGAPVINGEVKYTVNRSNYPIWGRGYSYFRPQIESVMVDQGVINTDEHGAFSITFKAETDGAEGRFDFAVNVDVLDSNGETRSGAEHITMSTLPYTYSIEDMGDYDVAEDKKVKIIAINADQKRVNSAAILRILKVKEPSTDDLYDFWQEEPEINQDSIDVAQAKVISKQSIAITEEGYSLPLKLDAGVYYIEITSEEKYDGKPITYLQKLAVTDFKKGKFPTERMLYISGADAEASVGKEMKIMLGTPDPDLMVYYHFVNDRKIKKHGWLKLGNKTELTYTPEADDKGGITLILDYVKRNKYKYERIDLNIPWKDKVIDVNLETRRDVTTPGSKEKWIITLKGENTDKIMGEMLATMYDSSLDYFVNHNYQFNVFPSHHTYMNMSFFGFDRAYGRHMDYKWNQVKYKDVSGKPVPHLQGLPNTYYGRGENVYMRNKSSEDHMMRGSRTGASEYHMDGVGLNAAPAMEDSEESMDEVRITKQAGNYMDKKSASPSSSANPVDIPVRENLNESVFFYPHIKVDGNKVALEFTMNEALTTWKLLTFTHDKDLRYGVMSHEIKTQKDLMILPNGPRFFREGDQLVFPATISNMSDHEITVDAGLELSDIAGENLLNERFGVSQNKSIVIPAGGSKKVSWSIQVPEDFKSPVKYKVWARSGKHTDGETGILPVVTNRKLITETDLVHLRAGEKETITASFNASSTAQPYAYTLEYTANPIWYAIQATPYIVDQREDLILSVFHKYYINTLAAYIVNSNPRIKQVFDTWKAEGSDALLSNLDKNAELKYALLNETPYVRAAQNETEQKHRIAMLFEANNIQNGKSYARRLLVERQNSDGGFSWYKGGRSSVHTTQSIVEGIAHLEKLTGESNDDLSDMLTRAINYMDRESSERYEKLKESIARYSGNMSDDHLDPVSIQYLYTRKYYDQDLSRAAQKAYDYYYGQSQEYWLNKSLQQQAMIAMVGVEKKDDFYKDIVKSLRERSFYSDELGRYWNQGNGYHWYDIPIETHALMVELFNQLGTEKKWVNDMKIWLLKQKQTNHWGTDKGTVKAIYALLLHDGEETSADWLEIELPTITIDGKVWNIHESEAGTGYIKRTWTTAFPKFITIKNNSKTIGWGSGYEQYFEQLDRVKAMPDNPLSIKKALYVERVDDSGRTLKPLGAEDELQVGDRVITRVEIKTDRAMDYIHLKDMRPLGFEPENTLSGYRWREGFGYYESTRDMSSNFFISHLPKGTYVFEYPQRVVHSGDYLSGIATIQSMYAPEFTSHSNGTMIEVK